MTEPANAMNATVACALADRLARPDDLLVRVLIGNALLVSLVPTDSRFAPVPEDFDWRRLVAVGERFFENKKRLRAQLAPTASAAAAGELTSALMVIARSYYPDPAHLAFVERTGRLLFSKSRLLLDILDGGRDPFEGIAG